MIHDKIQAASEGLLCNPAVPSLFPEPQPSAQSLYSLQLECKNSPNSTSVASDVPAMEDEHLHIPNTATSLCPTMLYLECITQ